MINYNDVYLYQKFLDILKHETKDDDVIWYTIVKTPSGISNFTYTINDEIAERNKANREQFFNRGKLVIIIFDKIVVNKNTLEYIKNKYGHDETGECKRRELYGY